jgi:para-nitrobenzyl esterase
VWLHGGGLMNGAGSDYLPTRLVRRGGLVVVTVNYRLGNLGFLGFPGLANGGAFGVEDQQAALRWVRQNIAGFGGDPDNVTLAGESAGAHSVCAQLASPGAAGLFQRAIAQSTACVPNLLAGADLRPILDVPLFVPHEWQQGHGQSIAAQLGCTTLECLRGKPVQDLLAAPAFPLPAFGNTVLPEDPAVAVPAGRFNHVPLLTGTTRDEGTFRRLRGRVDQAFRAARRGGRTAVPARGARWFRGAGNGRDHDRPRLDLAAACSGSPVRGQDAGVRL